MTELTEQKRMQIETELDSREALPGKWSLLSEFHCVPVDMTEEEKRSFLEKIGSNIPGCTLAQVEDRIFGGFQCGDRANRRHVLFNTGAYSYTCPPQDNATEEERASSWEEYITFNLEDEKCFAVLGDGPFTEDIPEALREKIKKALGSGSS